MGLILTKPQISNFERRQTLPNDSQQTAPNFAVDSKSLYREEGFTDMKTATIRKLTPVNADGAPDNSRNPIFMGFTQLMSPKGAIPIQCMLKASSMEEALEQFPDAMKQTLEKMLEKAGEAQRSQKSRIVMP
jgi:hypothetical protein